MPRHCLAISFVALGVLVGATSLTVADARVAMRFGVLPLDLQSTSTTPLFGEPIDRAVASYNAAATAYDRTHGGSLDRIDHADMGVATTLYTIAPGVEFGSGPYLFRLDGQLGFGDQLTAIGLGVYPLGLQMAIEKATLYVSAGGSASWLDREGDGDIGGLVAARATAGVRLSRVVFEIGYNAFALGGTIDRRRLDAMMATRDDAPPPRPDAALAGGEARGIVDASLGVTF